MFCEFNNPVVPEVEFCRFMEEFKFNKLLEEDVACNALFNGVEIEVKLLEEEVV